MVKAADLSSFCENPAGETRAGSNPAARIFLYYSASIFFAPNSMSAYKCDQLVVKSGWKHLQILDITIDCTVKYSLGLTSVFAP